ncbi:MAG: GNAT family N-acetyltransferase [Clostridiales bacterium]|jgi:isopentenyldiphosphate isomerase/predicted acetyltransferase|nr:GNAT family N-acetyltransferase [Clostridiales bacterium]
MNLEYWEIYNRHRQKTNNIHKRGFPLKEGEYHVVVHIWIVNSKGEYLIQKRSESCAVLPGLWAVTGGSAICGETSKQACLRETKEELGIDLKAPNLAFTVIRRNNFCDVWLAREDVKLSDIVMQEEEVAEVRYATKEEIYKLAAQKNFMMQIYLNDIFEIAESNLSVKRASPEDFDVIAQMNVNSPRFYGKDITPDKFDRFDYYIICLNGEAAGFAYVCPKRSRAVFQIEYIYILPEYRRQRIALRALKRIEKIYPQAKKFVLKIAETDRTAAALSVRAGYKKLNFKRTINCCLVLEYYEKH